MEENREQGEREAEEGGREEGRVKERGLSDSILLHLFQPKGTQMKLFVRGSYLANECNAR